MYLEHLNLVVSDMEKALDFYQAAFPHWRIRTKGKGTWYGKPRRWLHLGDDYQYLALSDHGVGENRDLAGDQVGLAHFAFVVDNLAAVVTRLKDAGYQVSNPGAKNKYRKNAYFIDPAGYEVEFVEYQSDVPAKRNSDQ